MTFQISGGLDEFEIQQTSEVDVEDLLDGAVPAFDSDGDVVQVELGFDLDGDGILEESEKILGWVDDSGDLFIDTNGNGKIDDADVYIENAVTVVEGGELTVTIDTDHLENYAVKDAGTGDEISGLTLLDSLQIQMLDTIDWTNLNEGQLTELLLDMNRYADAASESGTCEASIDLDGDTLSITYGSGATLEIDMANATEAQLEMFAGALVSADAFGASELIDELANLGKIGTGGNYDFFIKQIMIDLVATANSSSIGGVADDLDEIDSVTMDSYFEAIIGNCLSFNIGELLMSGSTSYATQDALVQKMTKQELVAVLNTLSGFQLVQLLDFDMNSGSYAASNNLILDALISDAEAGNYTVINSMLLDEHLGSATRQAILSVVGSSEL